MKTLIKTFFLFAMAGLLTECGQKQTPGEDEPWEAPVPEKPKNISKPGEAYPSVLLFGTVSDYFSDKPIEGVMIEATNMNNELVAVTQTDGQGKYNLDSIRTGYNYNIRFSSPGYIEKTMLLTTDNIPLKADSTSWHVETGVTLFKHENPAQFLFLKQNPAARLTYNPKTNNIDFDTVYAIGIRKKIEKLLK